MKYSYYFEVNNISLCIKIEVRYHILKIIACFKNCPKNMSEICVNFFDN